MAKRRTRKQRQRGGDNSSADGPKQTSTNGPFKRIVNVVSAVKGFFDKEAYSEPPTNSSKKLGFLNKLRNTFSKRGPPLQSEEQKKKRLSASAVVKNEPKPLKSITNSMPASGSIGQKMPSPAAPAGIPTSQSMSQQMPSPAGVPTSQSMGLSTVPSAGLSTSGPSAGLSAAPSTVPSAGLSMGGPSTGIPSLNPNISGPVGGARKRRKNRKHKKATRKIRKH